MLVIVAALAQGCSTAPNPDRAGPPYPSALRQGRTLDVQVFRDGPQIRLTNTTARPLGPGRLWLNAWYSREIPAIEDFRDQYGAAFRGGGFFAARNPEALVLAQVEPAGAVGAEAVPAEEAGAGAEDEVELLGLIVVGGQAE
jgi:hypothetical protein